jgi:poly-gamma-glutamate synthesis protein (capsule biosynthesis protein)
VILFSVIACRSQAPAFTPPSVFISYTPTLVPPENLIGVAVPQKLREQANALDVSFALDVSPAANFELVPGETHIQWVYALVAPFATVRDDVALTELRGVWLGSVSHTLLMDASTLAAFTAGWGAPASGSVRSVDASRLLDTAWNESAWAIIPFEDLSPRWKVLTIDGQSPIHKNFDVSKYPLVVNFTLQTSGEPASVPIGNYASSKLAIVVLTGTTALTRATAFKMEQKGITYPGEEVRDIMREADIAHVSNEVSFYTNCPPPDPNSGKLVFCSDPKNFGLLRDVGVDVIELTGNHFADYGRRAMDETLALYKANNIAYFGGGTNYQDALTPALFEVNGNKIAFLGCNLPDMGSLDIAQVDRPGSAPCDMDYFTAKTAELKSQGYLVIFTYQWIEDYVPQPDADQVEGFHRMVDAGATIVSGSQAHFPKTMEFYNDAFIHYGLGNLFFDQMGNFAWMPDGIRREFLDRYVIYDGKLISVELTTTLLEDFARPRLMTTEERSTFLLEYFTASGWTPITDLPTPNGTSVP